jgi:hypothetical protein
MQMEDALPEAGKPNRNTWSIALPAGCTAIHHDVLVPANMLLQVWGDDGEALKLLKEYTSANDGDGEVITPAATIYGLQYRALVRTVTAADATSTDGSIVGGDGAHMAQSFTLDQTCTLKELSVKLWRSGTADGDIRCHIYEGGATPEAGLMLVYALTICAASAVTDGAESQHEKALTTSLVLEAGEYFVMLYRTGSTGTIWWRFAPTCYPKGAQWTESAYVWTKGGNDFWFRIYGDGSVCQDDVLGGTGEECMIDDIELTLASPFPTISALSEKSCYLWEALLTLTHADATVQTLSLLVPAEVGQEMEIDCEAQTVINKTTGENVAFGLVASDKGWLDVLSATDSLTYAEVGMTDTDVTVVLRDTYAA